MHRMKISSINNILKISRKDYQPHIPRTALPVYNEDSKAFMNKILSRFAGSTQMGYSVPRLIWTFYEHMVLKEQFEKFFQNYVFFFICQFRITRETIDCVRFIRCAYEDYWYEAALLDLAGFLADRILVRCM